MHAALALPQLSLLDCHCARACTSALQSCRYIGRCNPPLHLSCWAASVPPQYHVAYRRYTCRGASISQLKARHHAALLSLFSDTLQRARKSRLQGTAAGASLNHQCAATAREVGLPTQRDCLPQKNGLSCRPPAKVVSSSACMLAAAGRQGTRNVITQTHAQVGPPHAAQVAA